MQIYKCNISEITENKINDWFELMSAERKIEVMRLVSAEKRASKIAADHLCRKAISDFCGISPEKIDFAKNGYGKPYAKNLPVYFSISHSGDWVVCTVSDKETGIDIEKIRPHKPKSAEKFATEKELEYIYSAEKGFFEIWTLKEAYFKCIGTGLGADIKNVSFEINQSRIICSECGFGFSFHNIDNDYICSSCVKK